MQFGVARLTPSDAWPRLGHDGVMPPPAARRGERMLGLAVSLLAELSCGPDSGSADHGRSDSSEASTSGGAATGMGSCDATSASTTTESVDSSSSTTASAPTAQECFELQSQEECAAAGCNQWSSGRVVTVSMRGICECAPQTGLCLHFEGPIAGGSFKKSWVPDFDPDLVIEITTDYTTEPIGWTPCEDVSDPPTACSCFDETLDSCDNPGTD